MSGSFSTAKRNDSEIWNTDRDEGTLFTSSGTQQLFKYLTTELKFHISYHPQSSGIVQRMNRTIKDKLSKALIDSGKYWVEIIPAVPAEIRMTPNATTKMSWFEALMGHPFPGPWVQRKGGPCLLGGRGCSCSQPDWKIEELNGLYDDISLCIPLPSENPPWHTSLQSSSSWSTVWSLAVGFHWTKTMWGKEILSCECCHVFEMKFSPQVKQMHLQCQMCYEEKSFPKISSDNGSHFVNNNNQSFNILAEGLTLAKPDSLRELRVWFFMLGQ